VTEKPRPKPTPAEAVSVNIPGKEVLDYLNKGWKHQRGEDESLEARSSWSSPTRRVNARYFST
jgi:hypothetical protein